jgi:membrane-bound lytic murein transglycosylase A
MLTRRRLGALCLSVLASRMPVAMASDLSLLSPLPAAAQGAARLLNFTEIEGWNADAPDALLPILAAHAKALDQAPLREGAPLPDVLRKLILRAGFLSGTELRGYIERNFRPVEIRPDGNDGFLTGYYEPETDGSLTRTDAFTAPLLARPDDVVTIPQGGRLEGIPEGFAAARKLADGKHEIYPDREAIWTGAIADRTRPIIWLKDEVEVFFMQVQGSGRVRLPDGRTVRIAYSGRNGHPYTSIGRYVVQTGLMPLAEANLLGLKRWLRANPVEGRKVMAQNRSYVFFRLAEELSDASGPIGGAGLPLTPWRSIAVDRTIWPYGTPVWIDVTLPAVDEFPAERFRKLSLAEDTGSAILGAARADLYHGSGDVPGRRAGVLRHAMRFVVLWPLANAPDVR